MSQPTDPKAIFVIIPAYNENEVIRAVIDDLLPYHYQLVVIDDGSAVPLSTVLKKLPVYLLRHPVNLGQGAALQTGIEFALGKNAPYIVSFDGDGQHQAADIQKLLSELENDTADIVSGSRFLGKNDGQVPKGRKFMLQTARHLNFLFTGVLLTDAHNGLRAMTNKAATAIRIRQNGMSHATEILAEIRKNRLRHKEVPVTIRYTDYSKKKGQSAWGSFRILFDILLNKIFK